MIPVQPHTIDYFVRKMKNPLPQGIACRYYLSWEDAMWDVLLYKRIPSGSVALIPEFWCGDVIKNLATHGITCIHYPMDQNFYTKETEIITAIKKYNPAIVVIFHAVGIRNTLLTTRTQWIKTIPPNTLLIEDSVHSIIDTNELKILKKNHFIIDSWRKVMPLQGSALYGAHTDIPWNSPHPSQSFLYNSAVFLLWSLFQFFLKTGHATLAEKAMCTGYDVIGKSTNAAATSKQHTNYYERRAISKIRSIKRKQACFYEKVLGKTIHYAPSDRGNLRGYPMLLPKKTAQISLNKLRSQGLMVRFELNDSPWSKKHNVIFLPLGPHVTNQQIIEASTIMKLYAELHATHSSSCSEKALQG